MLCGSFNACWMRTNARSVSTRLKFGRCSPRQNCQMCSGLLLMEWQTWRRACSRDWLPLYTASPAYGQFWPPVSPCDPPCESVSKYCASSTSCKWGDASLFFENYTLGLTYTHRVIRKTIANEATQKETVASPLPSCLCCVLPCTSSPHT